MLPLFLRDALQHTRVWQPVRLQYPLRHFLIDMRADFLMERIGQLCVFTFAIFSQDVLYRGADLSIVWPEILATAVIGAGYFGFALYLFPSCHFGS